jgi:uncharacterized membrane protein
MMTQNIDARNAVGGLETQSSDVARGTPGRPRRDRAGTVLALAAVATGLIAGVYYAFACAVMPGLARSSDRTFLETMQNIDKQIENPVFFLSFFGALLLPACALLQQRKLGNRGAMLWTAVGLGLYVAGLLTTMGVNIPLNNDLAAAGAAASIPDPARVREHFEATWNLWNTTRAVLSTAALVCLVRALLLHDRSRA